MLHSSLPRARCTHTLHWQAEEAAAAAALEDATNGQSDAPTMGYSGSTDSIATATAAYDVDALLSDAKGERLGVDPRKLAQFVRLLQGGRATAGNGFNGDADGDPDDPQGAGTQTLRCACMRTFIEFSSIYIL
jgi:hypothetical protein